MISRTFIALLLCTAPLAAQRLRDVNANSWWIYTGDHPIAGPLGIFAEVQIRRTDFVASEQQTRLQYGATYRFSPDIQVQLGYTWLHTGQYGDFPAPQSYLEHRIYQQGSLKQHIRKFEIEHRVRNEQRWIEDRYQNRVRYQFKASIPLKDPWYLFSGDEILIHYGPNHGSTAFDQNRFFAGVGYKFTARNKLETGYFHQFQLARNGRTEESNHTLRVQFTSTVPLRRKR